MKTHRNLSGAFLLVIATAIVSAGCTVGYVREAARTSLASFVNDVLTTAVNEAIDPSD